MLSLWEEHTIYLLEDLVPYFRCSECIIQDCECTFTSWGRACKSCDDRLHDTCLFQDYQVFTAHLEEHGVQDSDRRFGRDLFDVAELVPFFPTVFNCIKARSLELRTTQFHLKLSTMTNVASLHLLEAIWTDQRYSAAAKRLVAQRIETLLSVGRLASRITSSNVFFEPPANPN
ncbi:hypothetical protein C8F04DRAFT_1398265 [Mycena alexandri]|uniref:Uncharacterized protein n=1 Tax=Mycena alexandri TaxID=1745969 RepID=A0AAD6SMP5_9AGAR|nr:hypothetical protein C8F04DRAFT_1398265 [Mycena alexandri]